VLFKPVTPIEEVVLTFNTSLVQLCSTALTIGLDNDLLEDGWVEDVFFVKGQSTEWMHNWLTFLLNDPQGRTGCGVEMSMKILSLLRTFYSNLFESNSMVSISMESVLKSFSLACLFCHSSKDLKLSSLLVIKCLFDDWLSPKMSHGDWIPLLQGSPAQVELCKLGEESYPSELRSMLLVTATAIAETEAGASTLIDWWKEYGTFRQLIKYASFLVNGGKSKAGEWCSWLELVSTLLHVCSNLMSSTDGIVALRVFTSALADELHPYIVSTLSTFVNHERTLQLGELVTVKHISFLLYALSKFSGRWHLALPKSIVDVQGSVVLFLVYAAQPALKPYFSAESRVTDGTSEARLSRTALDFNISEGWFTAVRPEVTGGASAPPLGSGVAAAGAGGLLVGPGGSGRKLPSLITGMNEYSFRVAHAMYTSVCYFLEFFLISLPSESMVLSAEAFNESFVVALIGVQMQAIHISAALQLPEHESKHGELLQLFGRVLNLTTLVQELIFKSSLGTDKHGRNSWRLMSNLTAAYALLKHSMDGLVRKIDGTGVDGTTKGALERIEQTLSASGEGWHGTLSSEEATTLLTPTTGFR